MHGRVTLNNRQFPDKKKIRQFKYLKRESKSTSDQKMWGGQKKFRNKKHQKDNG